MNPFTVAAPTALAFAQDDYMLTGEGDLTWMDNTTGLPVRFQAEYKDSDDADYIVLSPVAGTRKRVRGLVPETYDFRVKAVTEDGLSSSYATLFAVVLGAPAMPRVTGLEIFEGAGHFPFHSDPARFLALVEEFTATTPPAGWSREHWRDLLVDGLVMRYRTLPSLEGLPPGEGRFLACSFWLADDPVGALLPCRPHRQEAR